MEVFYDIPAREPSEDLIADWSVQLDETSGFDELMDQVDEFYSEALDEGLDPETAGYNIGLATGKFLEDSAETDEDYVRALRYGLGSSTGSRGHDRVKIVDLFEYGVSDFEEL